MTQLTPEQTASREKVLRTSLLLSALGPFMTGYAVLTSQSTTQLADFLRRGMELVAIFIAWWVFRQVTRRVLDPGKRVRLEQMAALTTAGAMTCSGVALLVVALTRLGEFQPGGSVWAGLGIALLGLLTNGLFWRRYSALTAEQPDPVIAAQQQLYRAKTIVDLCVTAALASVALAPGHPATGSVDLLGSIVVAGYLLWSGLRMAQAQVGSLWVRFQQRGS